MDCYPAKSLLRAELHAEARAGRVGGGVDGSGTPGPGAGVVLRIPLWSPLELEREREREAARRQKVAEAVSTLIASLTNHYLANRQLVVMRGIERRAQERIAEGVALSGEQIGALEKVVELEHSRVLHRTKVTQARLELIGMCTGEVVEKLNGYLKQFMPAEKEDEHDDDVRRREARR